ncbi:MAG: Gfo/Idh/MocA family oxidoreductase [Elusimicrobia bacterium]|nr:Gfo/Idh/MocA family oxidoreductase [Elusimicrobiota bacterium]
MSPNETLTGAIVGYGQVAHAAHTPAFMRRGWQIAAVVDENRERLQAAQDAWPGVRSYRTIDELLKLERNLDFIDIATPPTVHVPQVMAALSRGFHVLCEKPLALTVTDFARIWDAAERAGRVVYTVHNWIHAPIVSMLLEAVASGVLGKISHVEFHTLRDRPATQAVAGSWRTRVSESGGGILVDHGWHCLYILRRLLGERPKVLACRLEPDSGEAEEEATVFFRTAGATALMYLTWRASFRSNRVVVYGSGGSAELLDDELVVSRSGNTARTPFPEKLSKGSAHPEWFESMLGDFQKALRSPEAARQNLEEAAFCVATISLAYRSRSTPAIEGDKDIPAPSAPGPSAQADKRPGGRADVRHGEGKPGRPARGPGGPK